MILKIVFLVWVIFIIGSLASPDKVTTKKESCVLAYAFTTKLPDLRLSFADDLALQPRPYKGVILQLVRGNICTGYYFGVWDKKEQRTIAFGTYEEAHRALSSEKPTDRVGWALREVK